MYSSELPRDDSWNLHSYLYSATNRRIKWTYNYTLSISVLQRIYSYWPGTKYTVNISSFDVYQHRDLHRKIDTYSLNHHFSICSSCSSTMLLHSKLLLSQRFSMISTRRISLQAEKKRHDFNFKILLGNTQNMLQKLDFSLGYFIGLECVLN